jgi:hypothetical protein
VQTGRRLALTLNSAGRRTSPVANLASQAYARAVALTILIAEIRLNLDEITTRALAHELRNIADGAPRLRPALTLAERVDAADRTTTIEPDGQERYAFLRATNHLTRNGGHPELIELRDTLYATGAAQWRAYKIHALDDSTSDADYTSYALNYEPGDRLVTANRVELRVTTSDHGDPPTLNVTKWSPLRPRQVPSFVFEHSNTRKHLSIAPDEAVRLADTLTTIGTDSAYSAAQKILAATNLPTVSTDVRLNLFETADTLAAVETLKREGAPLLEHEPLSRELGESLPSE